MDIKTLESFRLGDAIFFHDELNNNLWDENNQLRPEVKKQLLVIAKDFIEELGIKDLDVKDITVSGSNAAYTYTPHSDLDLHILVDISKLPENEVYRELFTAKKNLYNDGHDITVHGVPVELYVQDSAEPVVSIGEYSILKDKWLRIPTKRRANFDQTITKQKYDKLHDIIKKALKSKDLEKVNNIITTIKRYRKAGLDKGGEFGPENLAYKALRTQGYIDKLYDLRNKLHSSDLSIEEGIFFSDPTQLIDLYLRKVDSENLGKTTLTKILQGLPYGNLDKTLELISKKHNINPTDVVWQPSSKTNEDYDPNGPPPGPEFKPTMPAGTVRVDVSDVYDWYKLGQHISNMKGLGKHDFGKGPPSTVLSFGDEDTEHKYIQDLMKTGLTTTDIDPAGHKKIKGQKTDPTYNVNESQFNKCFDKACKLYDKAVEKGLKPVLYQVADYKGDGSNADNRWAKLPQHAWSHYVTVIGKTVYDPSAKQFGDDKQEKYSIDKLKSEWGKIFKIRPKELQEKINPQITEPGFKAVKTIQTTKGPIKLVATNPINHTEVFPQFYIKGYNNQGIPVSFLRLNIRDLEKVSLFPWKRKDFKQAFLVAGNVSVIDDYKRLGIASEMYKFAKELGNDVKPSETQTPDGAVMWRGFEKNKIIDEVFNTKPRKKNDAYWEHEGDDGSTLHFEASNGLEYRLDIIPLWMGADEARPWEFADISDEQDDNGRYVEFSQSDPDNWMGGKKDVTGTGSSAEIFGIVVNGILQYVKKFKPPFLMMQAAEMNRRRLYNAMLTRLLPLMPGYKSMGPKADGMYFIYDSRVIKPKVSEEEKPKQASKSAIYSTDVYGMTAYHSKCLEPGCDWESKRYDSIKLAQNAAQKHAQKHFKKGVAEGSETITELRNKMYQYIKSILPKWPEYVLKDWVYNLARGDHQAGVYFKPDDSFDRWGFNRETILKMIADNGLSPDTTWQLIPNMKFTMDMFEPNSKRKLIGRAGGKSDMGMSITKDKERHTTQAALAQQQGGVRTEPVILIKTPQGYELLEGWHRTIQHFAKYPQGYTGPAYVAVAQGQQGVTEAFDQPYPIKWEKSDFGDHDALATLSDGTPLTIMFNGEPKNNWVVDFHRNNSQDVTGEGDAQRVFATVLAAIRQFIIKKKPNGLTFHSIKEADPKGTRTRLYDRLVQRYIQGIGYQLNRVQQPGQVIYKLTPTKNFKEGASGYIPSYAEIDDPRFKSAITKDVRPDTMKKDAKKFGNKISRAGIPPTLKASGKF